MYLKFLEKHEEVKPKSTGEKETIHIRGKINKLENNTKI
jgi:hypothetical protein